MPTKRRVVQLFHKLARLLWDKFQESPEQECETHTKTIILWYLRNSLLPLTLTTHCVPLCPLPGPRDLFLKISDLLPPLRSPPPCSLPAASTHRRSPPRPLWHWVVGTIHNPRPGHPDSESSAGGDSVFVFVLWMWEDFPEVLSPSVHALCHVTLCLLHPPSLPGVICSLPSSSSIMLNRSFIYIKPWQELALYMHQTHL